MELTEFRTKLHRFLQFEANDVTGRWKTSDGCKIHGTFHPPYSFDWPARWTTSRTPPRPFKLP